MSTLLGAMSATGTGIFFDYPFLLLPQLYDVGRGIGLIHVEYSSDLNSVPSVVSRNRTLSFPLMAALHIRHSPEYMLIHEGRKHSQHDEGEIGQFI